MNKTLGGDRLGSGQKQKVNLHGYERSTHDIGFIFRSTMSAGTLVPFIKEIALPGDTFDINLNCDVKTHPTVGPLFGSYKVQLDVFQCPIRLYHAWLHNNKLDIGRNMVNVKFPLIEMKARNMFGIDFSTTQSTGNFDLDNYQINPSCIFSYLGIRGVGSYNNIAPAQGARYFNALPWLSYWDIYKNYYANKQEEIGAVIHTGRDPVDANVLTINITNTAGSTLVDHLTPANPPIVLQNGDLLDLTNTGTTQNPKDILLLIEDNSQPNVGRWVPLLSLFNYSNTAGTNQQYIYNNSLSIGALFAWAYTDEAATPEIKIETFALSNLDDVRENILLHATYPAPYVLDDNAFEPFGNILKEPVTLQGMYTLNSQEGLALKTYQSDLLNNWISKDWIDGAGGISELTAIDTSGGSFTIDTLLISRKVYDVLNRIAMSGGTSEDWQEAVYDHRGYTKAYSPIYHGGLSKELVFQEVTSVAATDTQEGKQPLGTLAGKGQMSHKHKGGKVTIKVDEPSYIIGIVSITPRLDYSQGNDWDIHLETMDDLHKPGMDEIGFQELLTEQMAWWDTNYDIVGNEWVTKSAGKQPAWINYMTNINRVRGNFAIADNEMFMTLNRRYSSTDRDPLTDPIAIKDLTTYIDPTIYNQIFAETALDSQNFWTQIGIDMTVRRKISAKIMPNL